MSKYYERVNPVSTRIMTCMNGLVNKPNLALTLLSSVLMTSTFTTQAAAQISDTNGVSLDEIIVTAERRQSNIQDVPVAITALSADALDSQQIISTRDLSRAVPNLVTANNVGLGSSVTYFLRGVGNTESIPTFDLPIGTYVDEVFISRQNANQIALSGVERVEVLRGPQGTLFGRNTTGGAVSIVTKKPSNEFGGELELGYGSFDRISANGAVNLPVTESLAVRVSGLIISDDGYLDNELNDASFNGEDTVGIRGAIRYDGAGPVSWDGSVQWTDSETTGLGTPEILNADLSSTVRPVTGDLHTARVEDEDCSVSGDVADFANSGCQFNESETILAISNLKIETGIGDVNLISGYYENDFLFNVDFLGNSNQPVFGGLFGSNFYISNDTNTQQFSQEVKLAGDAVDGKLSYVVGAFFMNENNETRFIDFVNLPFMGINLPTTLADRNLLENETESVAVYGQADYAITDRLKLQAGLRWTEEDKTLALDGTSLSFATFSNVPLDSEALVAQGIPLEQTVSRVTPRFAAFYEVSEDINVYASYTEGFKSGGWNVRGTNALELQPFDEETVESFEIGFRSELFDNRLRLNATLFNAEYDDYQVPSAFPGSSTFLTLNSGEARVRGLEVDFIAAITENLQLFGNLGLQDGEYQELTPDAIAAGIGPELQRTPDVTGQLGFTNKWELQNNHVLQLGADVSYTSSHETSPSNDINGSIDDEALVNGQISWTLPNNIKIIGECSNCFDNVYVTQALFNQLYSNQPQRFNVRLKYEF